MKDVNPKQRGSVFIVPLGPVTSGRLVFTTSAAGVTLLTDPALRWLVHGRFVRRMSWVGFEEGTVMVGYYPDSSNHPDVHRSPFLPLHRRSRPDKPEDEITLNASIPWEIEFRGGIADLNADLSDLDIRSMDALGGADRIKLLLSRPSETTFIYITGGIRESAIRVPAGVGVRVQVGGGASNLMFGNQRIAVIDKDIHLENPSFKSATSRCNICIASGANYLTIEEQHLPG